MLEILTIILFCWLFFKAMGLALRLAWGTAKILALLLSVLAVPALVLILLFTGGILLLLPVTLVGAAFLLLKAVT